jgi:hypothetical protein
MEIIKSSPSPIQVSGNEGRMKTKLAGLVLLVGLFTGKDAMSSPLSRSLEFFERLSKDRLELVDQFYDQKIFFQDPIHQIQGVQALRDYYARLYQNVEEIRFEYKRKIETQATVILEWQMFLKTPALNSGKTFSVDGSSLIEFSGPEGKAIFHRDYFDMGEFIYERVPVLKFIIQAIKKRIAGA